MIRQVPAIGIGLVGVLALLSLGLQDRSQTPQWEGSPSRQQDSLFQGLGSVSDYVRRHLELFATEEYWERRRELRSLQRRGYAEALVEVGRGDGLMAACSYLKTQLQIHYSVNHTPIPGKRGVTLPFDWTFPRDPWAGEP